ncbi:NADH:ubiquinone oxidoreductase [Loktanella sp. Alg231-35]|uniref:NADH:ubiquinone oxidoreductase n=1 Tax=Loktanella sp. Alg231-35 TaxID=1922220 RepID=UPI000D55C51C|nr:NADH:ubiquinone oxidoreductase [Loktanella sp. Alg231-35]
MKDTAPISSGILAVAALFGVIALGVAYFLFGYGFFGSFFIGLIVAIIVAIVLLLGRREPQAAPAPKPAEAPKPAPAPAAAAAAPVAAAPKAEAAPAPKAEPAPAPKAAAAPAPKPEPAPAAAASADGTPEFLSEAREGGPDDLKQIKGVGPKLEKTLHGMGIYHFDQIASWGPKEQSWMDDNLAGFKGRASRDEWVSQAKTLAAGGKTEFSKKVDKGGVY